jgi:hypothetical protein
MVFFGPRSKNVYSTGKQIGTPFLQTHQHEVLNRRRHHGKLQSPNTTNSKRRAGFPNNPRHQKVSPSKLERKRHSLGRWRGIAVDLQHHVGGVVPDGGVRMGS